MNDQLDAGAADGEHAAAAPALLPCDTGREQHWSGAFNARDLAGIPVADGCIRPGVLFRSGQPQAWQPSGWQEAAGCGVRRIIDLRDPSEPHGECRGSAGISYEFTPVEDPTLPEFRERFVPYLDHPNGYAEFLEMFAPRVAAAIRRLCEAGAGSVVCCSAGRDRTGLVTGLLLRGLGASVETLLREDELATRAVNEHHRVRKTPHPYERYRLEPELRELVRSRAVGLRTFFAGLDARKLLAEHGVGQAHLAAAAEWLLSE